MARRHTRLRLLAALIVLASATPRPAATADGTPGEPAPPSQAYFVQPFSGLIESYGSSLAIVNAGPHQAALALGSVNFPAGAASGAALPWASFGSSVTYRYTGLFGGVIRPVARFTVGAAQSWRSAGGRARGGYLDFWTPYAMPEAGLEIVYKGVGVGVTAGYPLFAEPYDPNQKFSAGFPRGRSRHGGFDWGQLLKNVYLIVE